jgi:hypothetical protein
MKLITVPGIILLGRGPGFGMLPVGRRGEASSEEDSCENWSGEYQ